MGCSCSKDTEHPKSGSGTNSGQPSAQQHTANQPSAQADKQITTAVVPPQPPTGGRAYSTNTQQTSLHAALRQHPTNATTNRAPEQIIATTAPAARQEVGGEKRVVPETTTKPPTRPVRPCRVADPTRVKKKPVWDDDWGEPFSTDVRLEKLEGMSRKQLKEALYVDLELDIMPAVEGENLIAQIGGDLEFVNELLDMHNAEYVKKQHELETAFQARDWQAIREISHSLKGASMNLFLCRLRAISWAVESRARCILKEDFNGAGIFHQQPSTPPSPPNPSPIQIEIVDVLIEILEDEFGAFPKQFKDILAAAAAASPGGQQEQAFRR